MKKINKDFYHISKTGQITFSTIKELQKKEFSAKNIFMSQIFLMIITGLCAIADFGSLKQLFDSFLYDTAVLRYIAIFAMLVGFDIAPIYLGFQLKKRMQNYYVDRIFIIGFLATFITAVSLNFILRITVRNLAFPDLSIISTISTIEPSGNPNALIYSIAFALFPVITSIVTFLASLSIADPLKNEIKYLTISQTRLKTEINKTLSILAEYENDNDYFERLQNLDQQELNATKNRVQEHCNYLKDYCRHKLKEIVTTPEAISELSHRKKSLNYINDIKGNL